MALSFAFDANTETPESAARRRALAEAIMGRTMSPQNVGEGFGAIASGIVANVNNSRAQEAETAGRAGANDAFSRLVSGITGGSPAYSPSGALGAANGVAASGDGMNYRDAIASIESAGSGDYNAVGPTHPKLGRALGRYQVMEANIGPWSRQVLGREVTPDEFMANPKLQDAIFDGIFGGYVDQFGPAGAAQAWFAGPGSVGAPGAENRSDSLGTTVSSYVDRFNAATGGAQPTQVASLDNTGISIPGVTDAPVTATPQSAPMQTAQAASVAPQGNIAPAQPRQQVAQGPSLEELLMVSQNPWLTDSQRSALNTMIETQLQRQDPRYQQQLQMGDLQIQQLQQQIADGNYEARPLSPQEMAAFGLPEGSGTWIMGPDNTPVQLYEPPAAPEDPTSVREYEYYVQQAQALGEQPVPYVEWDNARKAAGAINVDARNMGSIPAGYSVEYDDNGNPVRMVPIPGSPAAMEAEAAAASAEGRGNADAVVTDTIVNEASKARNLIGPMTTGAGGWALSNLGFTEAADMYRHVGALKSIAASENIQAMREASPTGGALGNASDADIRLLQDKAGALDPASPSFPAMLDDYERTLLRIVHGQEAGDRIFAETRPGGGTTTPPPAPQQSQSNPEVVDWQDYFNQ